MVYFILETLKSRIILKQGYKQGWSAVQVNLTSKLKSKQEIGLVAFPTLSLLPIVFLSNHRNNIQRNDSAEKFI